MKIKTQNAKSCSPRTYQLIIAVLIAILALQFVQQYKFRMNNIRMVAELIAADNIIGK